MVKPLMIIIAIKTGLARNEYLRDHCYSVRWFMLAVIHLMSSDKISVIVYYREDAQDVARCQCIKDWCDTLVIYCAVAYPGR